MADNVTPAFTAYVAGSGGQTPTNPIPGNGRTPNTFQALATAKAQVATPKGTLADIGK